MTSVACRICASTDLDQALRMDGAPRNIERLFERIPESGDQPVQLRVMRCRTCGHVQLPAPLEDDYYEDYLMTHSHAKKMQDFQRAQAEAFVARFDLCGKRVFEAGCGDGRFSGVLRELGCLVSANEPSAKAREACRDKGLDVRDGYLGRGAFPDLNATFHAVVARQVLEHVPDPNDFLEGVRELLVPWGHALIEVPALEQALEHDRFFDFFPDHLSYFSGSALVHLASRCGFSVERLTRAMDGEYNEIWLTKLERPDLSSVQRAVDGISGAFRRFLRSQAELGRRTAIWGAGAKGVLTLAMVDCAGVAYLIDKDPVKRGRYTPVSHLQVWAPERLSEDPVDTVIITALAYKDEITRDLRVIHNFQGNIAYLAGGDIVEADE